MKSTGIIRHIDELGRIVIPKEMRRNFGICDNDPLEIFTDGEYILLKKKQDSCIFCKSTDSLSEYKGKCICKICLSELVK